MKAQFVNCIVLMVGIVRPSSGAEFVQQLCAGDPKTIVYYGTSLTNGGAWVPGITSWYGRNFSGPATVNNSGMPGRASRSGLLLLQSHVLNFNPDVVFIEFSMNDAYRGYLPSNYDYGISIAESRSNLEQIIDRIMAHNPNAEIVLQTMNISWGAVEPLRPELAAYYDVYRDVAADRGLTLVDNHSLWQQLWATNPAQVQLFIPDGVHPIGIGHDAVTLPNLKGTLPFLGDATCDGVVDGSDFSIWNANRFRADRSWSTGDFNDDRVADGADFAIWNSRKFQSARTSVPEPTPAADRWILLAISLLATCLVRQESSRGGRRRALPKAV